MLYDLHIFSNVGSKRRQEWDYLRSIKSGAQVLNLGIFEYRYVIWGKQLKFSDS